MSDFDFDELDKAVAGAIGDPAPRAKDETEGEPEKEVRDTEDASEPEPSTRPAVPAARRSSGRFMDVMHPSSDMRTRSGEAAPSTRQATPQEEVAAPAVSEAPERQPEDAEPWAKPLESPFLPDAKVEKRPLGGEPVPESLLSQQPDELLLEAPDEPLLEATTMPDPIDFAAHSAAASFESEEDTAPRDEVEAPIEDTEHTEEAEQTPEIKGTPFAIPFEDALKEDAEPLPEPQEPTGPSSITQQYTEQPASQQESGAIYDTENYHQPVAHHAKKHAGAWTILWISLLVILGAGAGVAFYLFVLPVL